MPIYICRHAKDQNITEIFNTKTNTTVDSCENFRKAEYKCHQLNKTDDPFYNNTVQYNLLEKRYSKPLNYYGLAYEESLIGDQRQEKWAQQREEYGFDCTELWSLDNTIAAFILPRLKMFRDNTGGHPLDLTQKEWENIIDQMIWSFEYLDSNEIYELKTLEERDAHRARVQSGLDLFAKYFMDLWN